MQTPRTTETPALHLEVGRFHARVCGRDGSSPLFAQLNQKMQDRCVALKAKMAAVAASEEASRDLAADTYVAEQEIWDEVRDFQIDLLQLDKQDASLGARAKAFPEGFGEIVTTRGEALLKEVGDLKERLAEVKDHPVVAAGLARLDAKALALAQALTAQRDARRAHQQLVSEEGAACQAVREQLKSAFGLLTDLFKSSPDRVERFFLRFRKSTPRAKKAESATTPAPRLAPELEAARFAVLSPAGAQRPRVGRRPLALKSRSLATPVARPR